MENKFFGCSIEKTGINILQKKLEKKAFFTFLDGRKMEEKNHF